MSDLSNESAWQWADLLGYNADHKLLLVVELKSKAQSGAIGMAKHWLQQVGRQRPELYALFITPDFIALRLPALQRLVRPCLVGSLRKSVIQEQLLMRLGSEIDYIVEAAPSLDFAIDTQRISLGKLGPDILQRVVESWLESCLAVPANELQNQPFQVWLVESGLHNALWNGRIKPPAGGPTAYAFAG